MPASCVPTHKNICSLYYRPVMQSGKNSGKPYEKRYFVHFIKNKSSHFIFL
ncbi:hypothetical protein SXCC_04287 [Gluconacetobacter sp. SXCC-1]|nr:hypothetical protein SXCC_04287 [Gluconacetobacter sp. SXCC-1]